MSESELVSLERSGAVATITLQRPERHNALTAAMKSRLRDLLEEVGTDQQVRAVLLTGAGRSFCVGQDLVEHAQALDEDPDSAFDTVEQHYGPVVAALAGMPKPVIAAVNGTCVGAGLGLALAADLRVFAAGATLGTAFSAIGLTFDTGLSFTLARSIGVGRAAELMLRGDSFTAEQAVEWGIGGTVVDAVEVLPAARELAEKLAAGPTLAYAATKRSLLQAGSTTLAEALADEVRSQAAAGATADHRGAVTAFLAKRTPEFEGR